MTLMGCLGIGLTVLAGCFAFVRLVTATQCDEPEDDCDEG
jgi:hypothetical protein